MDRSSIAVTALRLFAVSCMVCLVGCANWKATPDLKDSLRTIGSDPQQSHVTSQKRFVVEVDFVHLPLFVEANDPLVESWQWVDETSIEPKIRQRMFANGIRVGRVTDYDRFRGLLTNESVGGDVVDTFLRQASIATEVASGKKQYPMRYGRRYELPVRNPTEGQHVMLLQLDGETVGRTLPNAQYLFAMTARPSSNAQQIELNLQPEVQYGDSRQKFVSSDTALRIDTRRESWAIEQLEMNLTLQEGDTIVFAPTMPLKGLAKQMLSSPGPDQQPQQTIILLRVAQVPTAVDQM